MKITLSSGKTFDALWIGGPTIATGSVLMEIYDKRLISEIAKDFEGIEKITAEDKLAGQTYTYEGFSALVAISISEGKAQMTMRKLEEEAASEDQNKQGA